MFAKEKNKKWGKKILKFNTQHYICTRILAGRLLAVRKGKELAGREV